MVGSTLERWVVDVNTAEVIMKCNNSKPSTDSPLLCTATLEMCCGCDHGVLLQIISGKLLEIIFQLAALELKPLRKCKTFYKMRGLWGFRVALCSRKHCSIPALLTFLSLKNGETSHFFVNEFHSRCKWQFKLPWSETAVQPVIVEYLWKISSSLPVRTVYCALTP